MKARSVSIGTTMYVFLTYEMKARSCNCTSGYPNIGDEEEKEQTLHTANDFCKLRCASFYQLIRRERFVGSANAPCELCIKEKTQLKKTLNEVAERCNIACFQVCNMKSDIAVVAAN